MSDADDELLPLSGVQHVIFCPRQAALIHVERIWLENAPTALGRILHERVDLAGRDTRRGVRLGRAVQLRSLRLGLYGVADVVEYHDDPSVPGGVRPYPVEYKRGSKLRLADQVQLCAQAVCLEDCHGVEISTVRFTTASAIAASLSSLRLPCARPLQGCDVPANARHAGQTPAGRAWPQVP